MKERIAIIEGLRTPYCKAPGALRPLQADDLGAFIVKELLARVHLNADDIDELIFGNVLTPPHATNIARVIAVKGGLPVHVPSFTVSRNCASGLEALSSSANKLWLDRNEIMIAGGSESMSHFPILFSEKMRDFLNRLSRSKGLGQRLAAFLTFRPSLLYPVFPEIADPLCGLSMGQTAEILSREFKITRTEQDKFALRSHQRATQAIKDGRMAEEIIPIPVPPDFKVQQQDEGPRANTTLEALSQLKPVFDKLTGTVTAGNSSPITDGAAAVVLMKESKAKQLGLRPLGYFVDYAEAGLEPSRMGLGPVFATSRLLKRTGRTLNQIDLIEINEAFAAQVLAVQKAFASDEFAKRELGRDKAIGTIDPDKLNVNGGAIALGHPLGASGTRLVITLLRELKRRGLQTGLATLCIGGGQGQAALLEVL